MVLVGPRIVVVNETVVIKRRFRGPSDSGNGGYTGGLLAGFVDGPSEVTLKKPPPLDVELRVIPEKTGATLLLDDETIAEASLTRMDLAVPPAPTLDSAREASTRYPGFLTTPFPECFVCGPERSEGDGLRVFCAPIEGGEKVAGAWRPPGSLVDDDGIVPPEFVWAALDCPGGWALLLLDETEQVSPWVLGRISAQLLRSVTNDEQIVIGWPISRDGRKGVVGTALFNAAGELCGRSQQTWIQLR
jgi:hypothetical protein